MTEEEAKQWLRLNLDVPRETFERLEAFAALVREESQRQNLIAASTLDHIWARHIVDSAQLLRFDPDPERPWLDLGSGPGFPGLIVAALRPGKVVLVEERKLRCEFLHGRLIVPRGTSGRHRLYAPGAPETHAVCRDQRPRFRAAAQIVRLGHSFLHNKKPLGAPKGPKCSV